MVDLYRLNSVLNVFILKFLLFYMIADLCVNSPANRTICENTAFKARGVSSIND